jgi:DNA-binding Lrp family transcriptional regulator
MSEESSRKRRIVGETELSAMDLTIVEALQHDARGPLTALAAQLGTSEASVRRRVRALVETDVIAITAVADPSVFGLDALAWLGLSVEAASVERVAAALVEMPEIDYAVITAGELNVMAEAACATTDDLYALVLALRSVSGVRRTETFPYLRLLRQSFEWNRRPGSEAATVRAQAPGTLRPLDIDLIRALQRNGRASFRELSAELGVSERLVSSRYSELVDMGAVRVSAVVNPRNLGWDALAWLGIHLDAAADLEEVAARLAGVTRVSYLVVASGRYDLMAEVVCRTDDDLLATLTGPIGGIEGIASVELFPYLRLHYRTTAGAWSAARSLAGTRRQS